MMEEFFARPGDVAGLGRLAYEVGTEALGSFMYFREHAVPHVDFSIGTLSIIREPFAVLEGAWRDRHGHLAVKCRTMGEELNHAAWLYHDQESQNYDAINAAIQVAPGSPAEAFGDSNRQSIGTIPPYRNTVDYGAPEGIDYPAPQTIADDFGDVIREAGGWVADVDHFIEQHSGTSPTRKLLEPIGGNWNEVKRLGAAFRIAGEAMEHASDSLNGGVGRVGPAWDGAAAVAFDSYARAQVAAMKWEGPVGRVLSEMADRIAEEMKLAVIDVVHKLKELIETQFDLTDGAVWKKTAFKQVPFIGPAYQITTVVLAINDTIDIVQRMVAHIKEVTDAFAHYISMVTSPSSYLNEKSEQVLAPILDLVDKTELALDVKEALDMGPMYEAPKDDFGVGTGEDPWKDAL